MPSEITAPHTMAMNLSGQPNLYIFPKTVTTDYVQLVGEVDKGDIEVFILFLTFLLGLSRCKGQVLCLSATNTGFLLEVKPDQEVHSSNRIELLPVSFRQLIREESSGWFPLNLYRLIMDASLNLSVIAYILHIH